MAADIPPARSPTVRLVFPASALAVRAALERLFGALPPETLPGGLRETAEIVMSEVLNNIVEHAYAGHAGEIALSIRPVPGGLHCTIGDRGRPMPGGSPPRGEAPDLCPGDLPEGGFGWHLIRSLARDIRYCREGGENRLTFHIPGPRGGEAG